MFEKEFAIAKKAALEAGKMLKEQKKIVVDSADGKDIKLAMDRASEAIIINCLETSGIPILSEECGLCGASKKSLNKGMLWIIDPLDGSANYWKGMKELVGVSIALWEDGKPVLGIINRFSCNELFTAVVGKGAWLNDLPITSSSVEQITKAVLATGFPLKRNYDEEELSRFVKQVQNFKKVRMLGAAAIMGAFVACGRIDVYVEESIMLWDIAASSAIVLAAGGEAEIEMDTEYKCTCKLFASKILREEFYKKCV